MMDNDPNADVGRKVAELRQSAGWSQAVLASRMTAEMRKNIEPLTVTRLENGKRPIVVNELLALATIFEVEPASLLPAGTPLLAQIAQWQARRDNRLRGLDRLEREVQEERTMVDYATDRVKSLQRLLELKRTGRPDPKTIRWDLGRLGKDLEEYDDFVRVLLDVGLAIKDIQDAGAAVDAASPATELERVGGYSRLLRNQRIGELLAERMITSEAAS